MHVYMVVEGARRTITTCICVKEEKINYFLNTFRNIIPSITILGSIARQTDSNVQDLSVSALKKQFSTFIITYMVV